MILSESIDPAKLTVFYQILGEHLAASVCPDITLHRVMGAIKNNLQHIISSSLLK